MWGMEAGRKGGSCTYIMDPEWHDTQCAASTAVNEWFSVCHAPWRCAAELLTQLPAVRSDGLLNKLRI